MTNDRFVANLLMNLTVKEF